MQRYCGQTYKSRFQTDIANSWHFFLSLRIALVHKHVSHHKGSLSDEKFHIEGEVYQLQKACKLCQALFCSIQYCVIGMYCVSGWTSAVPSVAMKSKDNGLSLLESRHKDCLTTSAYSIYLPFFCRNDFYTDIKDEIEFFCCYGPLLNRPKYWVFPLHAVYI